MVFIFSYQIALDLEFELIDLIENKEYEKAHAEFYEKIFRFKKIIKDEKIRNYDKFNFCNKK